jgi:hypothetical protein
MVWRYSTGGKRKRLPTSAIVELHEPKPGSGWGMLLSPPVQPAINAPLAITSKVRSVDDAVAAFFACSIWGQEPRFGLMKADRSLAMARMRGGQDHRQASACSLTNSTSSGCSGSLPGARPRSQPCAAHRLLYSRAAHLSVGAGLSPLTHPPLLFGIAIPCSEIVRLLLESERSPSDGSSGRNLLAHISFPQRQLS